MDGEDHVFVKRMRLKVPDYSPTGSTDEGRHAAIHCIQRWQRPDERQGSSQVSDSRANGSSRLVGAGVLHLDCDLDSIGNGLERPHGMPRTIPSLRLERPEPKIPEQLPRLCRPARCGSLSEGCSPISGTIERRETAKFGGKLWRKKCSLCLGYGRCLSHDASTDRNPTGPKPQPRFFGQPHEV
jgi:hypothetical protein